MVMEVFPILCQVEGTYARKVDSLTLAGSNRNAVGLRQAEPLL
jgi:hypothetical protein